jgi:S-adenosylmethionine synthetase
MDNVSKELKRLPPNHFYFTSESVTEGHPDKICDSISDSILDECLRNDPESKVAIETVAKSNMILLAGEITTKADLNFENIVRNRIKDIGYDDEKKGINYKTCDIIIKVTKQSPEIGQAVHEKKKLEDIGAGDQGIMFGYATDETKECMPFSHLVATRLALKLTEERKKEKDKIVYLRPDGKTQVTVEYKKENGEVIPVRVETILISAQHDKDVDKTTMEKDIKEKIINPVFEELGVKNMLDENTKYYINPSGMFVVGGPEGDAGLTGRKIIVDTYGGWGAHGGGCFSGKDCSKVDRSGAYMARWIAKSLVKGKLCKRCLVQISYSIGISHPLSVYVDSYGTATDNRTDEQLAEIVIKNFDMRPGLIIKELDLQKPIFLETCIGGHFGRENKNFKWEIPKELKLN